MALLDDIRKRLRISATTTNFDDEIQELIDGAVADLALSGVASVKANDETDALIKRAITTYVKANFGYDNPDADRLQQSYEMLKQHLALSQDYARYLITFIVTSGGIPVDNAIITIGDEVIVTNSKGIALYAVAKTGIDLDYTITATSYQAVSGSVYVDGSTTVEVALIEA